MAGRFMSTSLKLLPTEGIIIAAGAAHGAIRFNRRIGPRRPRPIP
jgi:hypothetical protein